MNQPMLFGKYCLLERISIGGMAEVFRAKPFHAQQVDRYLALKRILPHLAEDEDFIKMFVDEAKLCVHLRHPNIVHIYELGQFQASYYILMEYISGQDVLALQKRLRKQRLIMSVAQACYIAMELCKGLAHAHQARDQYGTPLNIIHRDVSPQNVLITYRGQIKLIDFGVAKAAVQSTKTQVGVLKGKFGYMSPEQISGNPIDHRSDIFAIGTVLWEMLTNRRLFKGDNEFEVFQKVKDAQVEPPSAKNPQVPAEVDRIVMKALAASVNNRYQSCDELAQDLGAFLRTLTPVYSAQHLAEWMQKFFSEEYQQEYDKHDQFKQINTPDDVRRIVYGNAQGIDQDPDVVEDATQIWDVDIQPQQDEDIDAFVANHTVVAAGGFDMEEFMHLDDADLIEVVDDRPNEQVTLNREQLSAPTMDMPRFSTSPHMSSASTQVNQAIRPSEVLAKAKSRRNTRGVFAAVAVVCVLLLLGFIIRSFVKGPPTVDAPKTTTSNTSKVATLVITVSPSRGAEILVDGVKRDGGSPLSLKDLKAGPHTISIRHQDYKSVEQVVTLKAGEFKPFHVELKAK